MPQLLGPVTEQRRINALDAVRGFALLGILLVNIQIFGEPFGDYIIGKPEPGASPAGLASYYFVKIFCDGKFYPLFSLMFGMGLALQWQRAREVGRKFIGTGLRRLLVLAAIGLAHAFGLWFGDILFIYSTAGVLLLFMLSARPRTLVIVGVIFVLISTTLMTGLGSLQMLGGDRAPREIPAEVMQLPPSERLMKAAESYQESLEPSSPFYRQLELDAYGQGPYQELFIVRAVSFLFFLPFAAMGFWWHIAAMFLFGAALLKAGIFEPHRAHWHRRFITFGLGIGLPLNVVGVVMLQTLPEHWSGLAWIPIVFLGGPLLSLAYLGGITLLVRSGKARLLTSSLTAVGRMALTNYLLQSVIATTLFYYYGYGLYGETTREQRMLIVIAIYAAQVVFSLAWLSVFRFGPMEWLWRTLTYLRPQPILR